MMSLAVFCKILPAIYVSLFAGHFVDRWPLRRTFIIADLALMSTTLVLALAYAFGQLHMPLLMSMLVVAGVVESVQSLAFQMSTVHFNKPEFFLRSQGVVALVETSPLILGPVLGAVAYAQFGLEGILFLDAASFLFALGTAVWIHFPATVNPPRSSPDFLFGLRWIVRQPLLSRLQLFFSISNFFNGLAGGLLGAFVLRHASNEGWSTVSSTMAVGSTLGALFLMQWKPKASLISWITIGSAASALAGRILFGLADSVIIWSAALALRSFLNPLISGANQAIWLEHMEIEKMGQIFGARRLLGQGLYPLAIILGGWLSREMDLGAFMVGVGALELSIALAGILFLPAGVRAEAKSIRPLDHSS